MLDASIFSRLINTMDRKEIDKYLQEKSEIILGRSTSMAGDILRFVNYKVVRAASILSNGKSVVEIQGTGEFEVAAGSNIKTVLNEMVDYGVLPTLFPLYYHGTLGGFIATNGSGFGSYRNGFVSYRQRNAYLKDKDTAVVKVIRSTEFIRTTSEDKASWSALYIDDRWYYYIPREVGKSLGIVGDVIDIKELVNNVGEIGERSLKKGKFPLILRGPPNSTIEEIRGNNLEIVGGIK